MLLNALTNPLQIGLYENDNLIKSIESSQKASEALPVLLDEILAEFRLTKLVYANGPGSYMGIKISYISLKTLSVVQNLPLFAVSAFELNGYAPIRANNALCFVYEKGEISLQKAVAGEFVLPANLSALNLQENNAQFYFLDAV